jgi:HlyD family secretion protein
MQLPAILKRVATPLELRSRRALVPLSQVGTPDDTDDPPPSLRRLVIAGLVTIGIAFGGFFGWAFAASLDSAAVASGTVIVDSRRKTISHLEGGIMREILVSEGDRVKAGDIMFRLDETFARSTLDQLQSQRVGALAKLTRLRAEISDEASIAWPAELDRSVPWIEGVLRAEERLFVSRSKEHEAKLEILQERITQYGEMANALAQQKDANARQLTLVREQLEAVRGLYEKGYERKTRVVELEVQTSELEGQTSELNAKEAEAAQLAAAAKLEIATTNTERQSQIATEMQEAQLVLVDIADRLASARNVLNRVEIRAPEDGLVTDLRYHTIGSTIGAGEPIVDLVPDGDSMIVEAHVAPRNIDSLYVGLPVRVRLTAYNQRTLPPLDGELRYVSADQQIDERTGDPYFVARVSIDPESIADAPEEVQLHPGMPAEVVIVTGERRVIDYLAAPLVDSMGRAFKEE